VTDYNYDRFEPGHYQLDAPECPKTGTKAPDFTAMTVAGKKRRLLDFDGKFLVLETGSITCPLFQTRRNTMAQVVAQNPDVSFAILYTREAHPGQDLPQHKTQADKQACAGALAHEDGENRVILVDELNGAAHQLYGGFPNAVFIINRRGCIVFQADWNNPNATGKALKQLKSGKSASVRSYFMPANPVVGRQTFRRAGQGSAADFFHSLPRLIWKNGIKRNLLTLFGRRIKVSPNVEC